MHIIIGMTMRLWNIIYILHLISLLCYSCLIWLPAIYKCLGSNVSTLRHGVWRKRRKKRNNDNKKTLSYVISPQHNEHHFNMVIINLRFVHENSIFPHVCIVQHSYAVSLIVNSHLNHFSNCFSLYNLHFFCEFKASMKNTLILIIASSERYEIEQKKKK